MCTLKMEYTFTGPWSIIIFFDSFFSRLYWMDVDYIIASIFIFACSVDIYLYVILILHTYRPSYGCIYYVYYSSHAGRGYISIYYYFAYANFWILSVHIISCYI